MSAPPARPETDLPARREHEDVGQIEHGRLRVYEYSASTALVAMTLGVAAMLRRWLALPDPEMLFLLAVMVTAVMFGRGPSLYSAALGVAAYDFFFVPPYLTFAVADRHYILTFATMFATGFVLSELAGRVKHQEQEALTREQRTSVLYALSRELSSADRAAQIAGIAARHAADVFEARAFVLESTAGDSLTPIGASPVDGVLEPEELAVATWAFAHLTFAGLGTDHFDGAACLCAPLRLGTSALGVLVLVPNQRVALRAEQRAFLDVFSRQVAIGLERVRLAEEARAAALRAKAEEMRSSLLSAVSHDLRTPLATITGAATSLRDDTNLDASVRSELVASICDEAERLERLVGNLLDMTRLESGTLVLKCDWVPLEEVIGSALTRLESSLSERRVNVDIPGDFPLLHVDPVLFEQIFINLFENACKYTPPGSPFDLRATSGRDMATIVLRDHGPGIAHGTEELIFEKFYRISHLGASGAGLGLSICRGIAAAHGGTIRAENAPGGGTAFQIFMPIGGTPPASAMDDTEGMSIV